MVSFSSRNVGDIFVIKQASELRQIFSHSKLESKSFASNVLIVFIEEEPFHHRFSETIFLGKEQKWKWRMESDKPARCVQEFEVLIAGDRLQESEQQNLY